ncbi:hypothetical protein F2P81_020876 [Scophthalmus maximus]|uniref:Secreted protein n=1 Tax=Scophthalmus maximus TaxID=52904 RepID=A0A6A4S0T8_SCOMX|nr:hypothetical protein F2P81_020876 [Scophthalmus maximus]
MAPPLLMLMLCVYCKDAHAIDADCYETLFYMLHIARRARKARFSEYTNQYPIMQLEKRVRYSTPLLFTNRTITSCNVGRNQMRETGIKAPSSSEATFYRSGNDDE